MVVSTDNTVLTESLTSEREFRCNEMFFSTTDKCGKITSGNDVFVRVSAFAEDELVGSPHNVIRHPDMPRAVFRLVWAKLEAGQSVAGYVKNRAKDGRYYWVMAYITPMEGGYLSIRLKPSTQTIPIVADLYREMAKVEQAAGENRVAGMDQSTTLLLTTLKTLGFGSYEDFMRHSLNLEMRHRDQELERTNQTMFPSKPEAAVPGAMADVLQRVYQAAYKVYGQVNRLVQHLGQLGATSKLLREKSQSLTDMTGSFRLISFNSAIEASRLGHVGASLGVISVQMGDTSSQIGEVVSGLKDHLTKSSLELQEILFMLSALRLQLEMLLSFCCDLLRKNDMDITVLQRVLSLEQALAHTNRQVQSKLGNFGDNLGSLDDSTEGLRRAMLTMQVATVSGLVEANRIQNSSFQQIFQEVRQEIDKTALNLKGLLDSMGQMAALVKGAPAVAEDVALTCLNVERELAKMG